MKTSKLGNKAETLRAANEKGQVPYKGRCIRITRDFSRKTIKPEDQRHL